MKKTFFKSIVAAAVVGAAVALSSVAAFAAEYTFNANDLTTGDITSTITAGTDNFFTIKATAETDSKGKLSQQFTVDGNNKTGPVTKTAYTQRIKSNGVGTVDYRCITFTVNSKASVLVEGMSSKSGETRDLALVNCNDTATILGTFSNDGKAIGSYTFNITEAGSYCLYPSVNGFNIYGIVVKTDDGSTIASTATQIGTTGDYYAVDTANGATYIIHSVTADEMAYESLSLQAISGTVAPTTTVYSSVEFADDSVLKAEDIGAEAIYAVKVTGTEGAAPTATSFTWVNA